MINKTFLRSCHKPEITLGRLCKGSKFYEQSKKEFVEIIFMKQHWQSIPSLITIHMNWYTLHTKLYMEQLYIIYSVIQCLRNLQLLRKDSVQIQDFLLQRLWNAETDKCLSCKLVQVSQIEDWLISSVYVSNVLRTFMILVGQGKW